MSDTKGINSHSISIQMIVYGALLVAVQIVTAIAEHLIGDSGSNIPYPVIPFFKALSTLAFYLPGISGIFGLVTGIRNLHNDLRLFAKIVYCAAAFFAEGFFVSTIMSIAAKYLNMQLAIYNISAQLLYLLVPIMCAATGSFSGSIAASLGRTYVRIASLGIKLLDPDYAGLALYFAVDELALTACTAIVFCLVHRNERSFKIILLKLITGLLNGYSFRVLVRLTICPIIIQNMAPQYAKFLNIQLDRMDAESALTIIGIPAAAVAIDLILIIRYAKRRRIVEEVDYCWKPEPVVGERYTQPYTDNSFQEPYTMLKNETRTSDFPSTTETDEPLKQADAIQQEQKEVLPPMEDTKDPPPLRVCHKCGFELIAGSVFCSNCGARIQQ